VRAAMVGGAAYHVGKQRQQSQYREDEQEARLEELEAQQQPAAAYQPAPVQAAPPPPAGAMTDNTIEQLTKLGQLHDSGVLTDDEFEQQKRRLLA
jgi:hypothetical protein